MAADCVSSLGEIWIDEIQPGGNWAALRGIVDDLRIPAMDGAIFLRWVKKSAQQEDEIRDPRGSYCASLSRTVTS